MSADRHLNPRVMDGGQSVWPIVNQMVAEGRARRADGVANAGQGMPDIPPPSFLRKALEDACQDPRSYQYARGRGDPRLAAALAARYTARWGREVDASSVVVSVGGCEALCATMMALLSDGDEAIVMVPFFDAYRHQIRLAGGTARYTALECATGRGASCATDWRLNMEHMASLVGPRTRLVVLNNPLNPLGKRWTREELEEVAAFACTHDLVVVADEVYECLAYGPRDAAGTGASGDGASDGGHVSMATLPGMWERTVTIGSAGKLFGVTGWKTGWAVAPAELAQAVWLARQWMSFSAPTPMQFAVANALEAIADQPDYDSEYAALMKGKRDTMVDALEAAGFEVVVPGAGYFVMVDVGDAGDPLSLAGRAAAYHAAHPPAQDAPGAHWFAHMDMQVVRWLIDVHGLASVPCGPAFFPANAPEGIPDGHRYIRFCFGKCEATLKEIVAAVARVAAPSS